jgi:hypothetical protein
MTIQRTFIYQVEIATPLPAGDYTTVDGLNLISEGSFELCQGEDFVTEAQKVLESYGKTAGEFAAVNVTYDESGEEIEIELVDTVTF